MGVVTKNRKAYDSGDVSTTINGVYIDMTEISYATSQEHQLNHTLKNDATSWSRGKVTHEGSCGIMMQDIVALEKAAPAGNLLALPPFEINVTFVNEFNDIVNDTVTAKFQDQGREVTGDMGLQKSYTLFVIGISYNNI